MQNFSKTRGSGGANSAGNAENCPKSVRKEAINDMKRTHIMDAALKVIAREGYMSTRLEDIAEEAGFSKATIYHYFLDKEALFTHIIIRELRTTYEICQKIIARRQPFLETMRELAHAFYDGFCGAQENGMAASPSSLSNFFVSMAKHEELFKAAVTCKKDTDKLFVEVISRAKQDGVLTIPVDEKSVCIIIMSSFHAFIMENQLDGKIKGQDDYAQKRENFNKAIDSIFTFLSPWIKEENHA